LEGSDTILGGMAALCAACAVGAPKELSIPGSRGVERDLRHA